MILFFNELLRILATRCLTPAAYFSSGTIPQSQFYHYGLAIPLYTHFTSPIRRYADVIVHRLLAACIGASPLPESLTRDKIQFICNEINRKARMSDIAARDSTRLFTLIFFKNKTIYEIGRVVQVRANGFSVLVPRYGIEGKVNLATAGANIWDYDIEKKMIYSKDRSLTVRIFDEVKVQITLDESQTQAPKLIFLCYDPPIHDVENQPDSIIDGSEENLVVSLDDNNDLDLNQSVDTLNRKNSKRKSKDNIKKTKKRKKLPKKTEATNKTEASKKAQKPKKIKKKKE